MAYVKCLSCRLTDGARTAVVFYGTAFDLTALMFGHTLVVASTPTARSRRWHPLLSEALGSCGRAASAAALSTRARHAAPAAVFRPRSPWRSPHRPPGPSARSPSDPRPHVASHGRERRVTLTPATAPDPHARLDTCPPGEQQRASRPSLGGSILQIATWLDLYLVGAGNKRSIHLTASRASLGFGPPAAAAVKGASPSRDRRLPDSQVSLRSRRDGLHQIAHLLLVQVRSQVGLADDAD